MDAKRIITRTNSPQTAQMYRKTNIQPVYKRQKAEAAKKHKRY